MSKQYSMKALFSSSIQTRDFFHTHFHDRKLAVCRKKDRFQSATTTQTFLFCGETMRNAVTLEPSVVLCDVVDLPTLPPIQWC